MARGRVLQFDQERGYGFIAADDGGEDVFLHASVFDGDSYELAPGMRVEFKVMAGDRGRKAFATHLVPDEPDPGNDPVIAQRPASPAPDVHSAPLAPPRPAPGSPSPQAGSTPTLQQTHDTDRQDDEPMCDVLSSTEFIQELTELLLSSAPTLSGEQILDIRQGVMECATKHGWVDI